MTKDIWLNLPVKNVEKAKAFFTNIGFAFKGGPGNNAVSAAMQVGAKNFVVMLFEENVFKGFTNHALNDTLKTTEVLISIDAGSKNEVDSLALKVKAAGGTLFSAPQEVNGWMYGFGFCDLDGHRWNVLHMDMSKMPKS